MGENILIRVYPNALLLQIGNSMIYTFYDWIMVFPLIRAEDRVTVQNYTNEGFPW